jgi:hypothetical protein
MNGFYQVPESLATSLESRLQEAGIVVAKKTLSSSVEFTITTYSVKRDDSCADIVLYVSHTDKYDHEVPRFAIRIKALPSSIFRMFSASPRKLLNEIESALAVHGMVPCEPGRPDTWSP